MLYLVLLSVSWVKTTFMASHEAVSEIEKGSSLVSVLLCDLEKIVYFSLFLHV